MSFWECSYHWTPVILTVSMVGFAISQIRQIRRLLDKSMELDDEEDMTTV